MTKIKVVTHNGSFHADDVFAYATLRLALGNNLELTRTRDPKIIEAADIVFDVGRQYDVTRKRFDHHQEGGAGKRMNTIPYASFGLVWKEYGIQICTEAEAEFIDEKLVQIIDAGDNGFEILEMTMKGVSDYPVNSVIGAFNKTTLEDQRTDDEGFYQSLEIATAILNRELFNAREFIKATEIIERAYNDSPDKRLIVIDKDIRKTTLNKIFAKYPEILFIVKPYGEDWSVRTLIKNDAGYESRKPLPVAWAGKVGEELQKITGVPDAIFCHNARFLVNTKSKEGAMTLAKLALES